MQDVLLFYTELIRIVRAQQVIDSIGFYKQLKITIATKPIPKKIAPLFKLVVPI
jgi:hypothetical protein